MPATKPGNVPPNQPKDEGAGNQPVPELDDVDESSRESFPASDAPAWAGGEPEIEPEDEPPPKRTGTS